MDGGAWKAAVHGVAKGRTRLNDFHLNIFFLGKNDFLAWDEEEAGERFKVLYVSFQPQEEQDTKMLPNPG